MNVIYSSRICFKIYFLNQYFSVISKSVKSVYISVKKERKKNAEFFYFFMENITKNMSITKNNKENYLKIYDIKKTKEILSKSVILICIFFFEDLRKTKAHGMCIFDFPNFFRN